MAIIDFRVCKSVLGLRSFMSEIVLQPEEKIMAEEIPEKYRDLFDKKAFANLATMMPDGTPQVTPVWVDFDGTHVLINSALGRQKDKNLRRNPSVAMSIVDPDNPY